MPLDLGIGVWCVPPLFTNPLTHSHTHANKTRRQPYKQHAQMDRAKAQAVWSELRGAIDEIFRKNASNLSFEHLYRWVRGLRGFVLW